MTINEAKTELREYRILSEKIISLQIRIINAKTKISGTYKSTAKEEAKLQELISRATSLRAYVEKKLNSMDKPYGEILHEKYIKNSSLLYVSTKLCYEYTWTCKLHKRALLMYCNI